MALSEIWNNYISDHPYDFVLSHEGAGVHLLSVHQAWPMPPTFAVEFGEWLYNARTCLDYIMWATAAHVTGHLPPPDEDTLQYPIYDSAVAWRRNEYRLKTSRRIIERCCCRCSLSTATSMPTTSESSIVSHGSTGTVD